MIGTEDVIKCLPYRCQALSLIPGEEEKKEREKEEMVIERRDGRKKNRNKGRKEGMLEQIDERRNEGIKEKWIKLCSQCLCENSEKICTS